MNDTITVSELRSLLANKDEIVLLDVRRKNDVTIDPAMIPGALWQDPEAVASWSKDLSPAKAVVIYCVRGGSVSKSIVDTLRADGVNVKYVEGGLAAWKGDGGRLTSIE